jgi:4-amino-4-deoxy-L-arabinose transferase-like glycosyltransferase
VKNSLRRSVLPWPLNRPESVAAFLCIVVFAAIVLRLIVVFFVVHDSTHTVNDSNFGWESWEMGWTARSIFLGKGFSSPFLSETGPTALVPPLYPYVIAFSFKLFGFWTSAAAGAVLSFNSLCSALTCIPLYFLTRNALNERVARIVACAWAVYPFAVYFSSSRVWDYALTSLLFTTCLLVAQYLHLRGWLFWFGFGALYGVAVLSNPSITTLLPVLLVIAALKMRRVRQPWFSKTALCLIAFLLVCLPWQIRNHRVMHADFFIRDGFALEAYAGNNGDTFASNSAFAHPGSNPAEMTKYQQMGEIAYLQKNHDLVVDFAKHHPGFIAVATLRRVVRFWTGYWSLSPAYLKNEPFDMPNIPFCLFLLYFMARGLIKWYREDGSAARLYLLAILLFPIPYYLTHASMDYRQPIEPIIIVLVTIGLFGTGNEKARSRGAKQVKHNLELEREPEAVLV